MLYSRVLQVDSITDTTQLQAREVDSTGSLKAGEKALADLRKRKLIVQRFVYIELAPFGINSYRHTGKDSGSL